MSIKKPKCTFRQDWLELKDDLGHKISSWGRKTGTSILHCNICLCSIDCEKKGFQAIKQHVGTQKHKKEADVKLGRLQLRLAVTNQEQDLVPCTPATVINPLISSELKLRSLEQTTIRAELLWALKCIASNYSAASCIGISDLFTAMFGSAVTKNFSLSRTKVQYLQTDCLGPHFYNINIEDARKAFYVICFDETTNSEGVKELQISLRYWSHHLEEVIFNHLETFFIGSATAVIIKDNILKALDNAELPLRRVLMLACDGPNVNKAVLRMFGEAVKIERPEYPGLLNIGTCNLHIVHNAFKKGLDKFGFNVSNFVMNVYAWFNNWPSRLEDFTKIQEKTNVPLHRFLKHVPSRWLSLSPAAKRILEQWPALIEYFLKFVPNKYSNQEDNAKCYTEIKSALKHSTMKAEIAFVTDSAELFETFSKVFQKQEPMIHVLYSEMKSLVELLAGRIYKKDAIDELFINKLFHDSKMLLSKDVKCGDRAEIELSAIKEIDVLHFRKKAQDHFKEAASHLLKKSILCSPIAKHYRCIHPEEIKKERSLRSIDKIGKTLSVEISQNSLIDEWKLLQRDDIPIWKGRLERIDHYWRQIFCLKNSFNESKYPNITKVVQVVLTLAHGSSDVERGFSESGNILTEDKTRMTVKTLNAKLNIKSGLKHYENKPELVPITQDILTSARFACSKYKRYLEDKKKKLDDTARKQKEDEEKAQKKTELLKKQNKTRKEIHVLEAEIKKAKKDEDEEKAVSDNLLKEGSERLKKALDSKDLQKAKIAYGMMEGAELMRSQLSKSKVVSLEKQLEKKKNALITTFFRNQTIGENADLETDNV